MVCSSKFCVLPGLPNVKVPRLEPKRAKSSVTGDVKLADTGSTVNAPVPKKDDVTHTGASLRMIKSPADVVVEPV